MAEIRVDQSHCNRYTAQFLLDVGWTILFTDPGRVSRGGTGTQGASLRIFEEFGLPIPDIVSLREGCLLLIEVDTGVSKAILSINTYRQQKPLLLDKFNILCRELGISPIKTLVLGFCRIGVVKSAEKFVAKNKSLYEFIDLWIAFESPQKPLLHWVKYECD